MTAPHPDYLDPHDPFHRSAEEAALVLLYSLVEIPENNLVTLPTGWSIALDHFYGGPGWAITTPAGDRFVAIFEEAPDYDPVMTNESADE